MSSRVINAGVLVNNHSLSLKRQPILKDLITIVREGERPLNIIVGAGASMGSGLPSWARLVDNMISRIVSEPTQELIRGLESSNLFRQAETAVQIMRGYNGNLSVGDIVRDALYTDGRTQQPGLLVDAIVRMSLAYGPHVRIVTTNFDNLLEQAINAMHGIGTARSFSLDNVDEWWSLDPEAQAVSILHLHGMVRQGDPPLEPLLLTESDFLAHGQDVQGVVSQLISQDVTLFVGLSMTDPNLLGPLFKRASAEDGAANGDAFALFTPHLGEEGRSRPAAEYAVTQARYLDERLGVRPILLKTHAQPTQVISEMALAAAEPDRYTHSAPDSLVYGLRLQRALEGLYEGLHVDQATGRVDEDRALRYSKYLSEGLHAPGGPVELINDTRELVADQVMSEEEEQFSAYLWLRHIPRPSARRITLGLIASSTYVHWLPWNGNRVAHVWAGTPYNVGKALFGGTHTLRNQTEPGAWRGFIAVPLIINGAESESQVNGQALDRLMVGAISLDTTGAVDVSDSSIPGSQVSPIARMDAPQLDALLNSIEELASKFINELSD
ncbi:hypothetical protein GCM10023350_24990 [Nocardioides endophyticus]|uniref:SIR2-like domain-containing protein n=1 Tax=Nocardioides endophyticus TaxID=1353775 RepID=A0ABP8YWR2_9ACTN